MKFWVQNTLPIALRAIIMILGFILENNKKNARWHHHYKILMRNVKIVIISILILSLGCFGCQKKRNSSWDSNLLSICAVFQPQWKKRWKTTIKQCFFKVFVHFWRFFEDYSILAEKQRNLTTNSSPLRFPASFDPPNVP